MVGVEQIIESLGPGRKNLVWLPPLTFGYLYYLYGGWLYLCLGLITCGGAMILEEWIGNLLGSGDPRGADMPSKEKLLSTLPRTQLKIYSLGFFVIGYGVLWFVGITELVVNFSNHNIIMVGFAFAYAGGILTMLVNGRTLTRAPTESEETQVVNILPNAPSKYANRLDSVFDTVLSSQEDEYPPTRGYQ